MNTSRQVDDWLREIEARPASAAAIIRLIANRLGELEEQNQALLAENIGVSMHFNPLHMMPYYRDKYGFKPEDFPNALRVAQCEISLPVQPQITERDAQDVVDAVYKVLGAYRR